MDTSTISPSSWYQGQYDASTDTYNGSLYYISSNRVLIPFGSQTLKFSGEGSQVVLVNRWAGRTEDGHRVAYIDEGSYQSNAVSISYKLLDSSGTQLTSGTISYSGSTKDISAYPQAKYVVISLYMDTSPYSYPLMEPGVTAEIKRMIVEDGRNRVYELDNQPQFEVDHYVWHERADGPHSDDAPVYPEDIEPPWPDGVWRIEECYNNGFPFNRLMPNIPYINFYPELRENVIRVYDKDEPQSGFVSNGLAILHPSSCVSIHNDDRWDITLTHPVDEWGKWRNLLVVNVLKVDGQLFRIKKQKPYIDSNGMYIEVEAKHITTDLADESCFDFEFSGGTPAQFVTEARSHLYPSTGYSPPYQFNISAPGDTVLPADKFAPASFLALLVGLDNSLLNRIGGELYRDNFDLTISKRMAYARDDAFNIRYSLDMTEITQEVDYSDFCTLLYCYDNWGNMWSASYAGTVHWAVHHQIVKIAKFNYAEGDGSLERLMADGQNLADRYLVPKVTYKLKIAALKNDPKYKDFLELQNYRYGDSGTIYCPELDISTKQRIVEIEKNELTGEIIGMTLGNMVSSVVRPAYMGSTVTSGYSASDKANEAMQAELNDIKIRQLKTWLGIRSYTWAEVRNNKWEEYR